jgi:hypothetical protein
MIKRIFEPLNFQEPYKLFTSICECLAAAALITGLIFIIVMGTAALRFKF